MKPVLKYLVILKYLIVLLSLEAVAQVSPTDSIGNWYVRDHKLVWEKRYPLEDKEELDRMLKSNEFTAELDILKFGTSALTGARRVEGQNLPEYAQHEYRAFLVVDFFSDTYRVRLQQIAFPDFEEKIYWNGMRQPDSRGSLEKYILRPDGLIKRNSVNLRVLEAFDSEFSAVFDPMAYFYEE